MEDDEFMATDEFMITDLVGLEVHLVTGYGDDVYDLDQHENDHFFDISEVDGAVQSIRRCKTLNDQLQHIVVDSKSINYVNEVLIPRRINKAIHSII